MCIVTFCLDLLLNIILKHCEGGFFVLLLPFTPLLNYDKCIKVQPPRRWEIFQWTSLYCLYYILCFGFLVLSLFLSPISRCYMQSSQFIFSIFLMLVFCFTIINLKLGYLQARISHHCSLIRPTFFYPIFFLFFHLVVDVHCHHLWMSKQR